MAVLCKSSRRFRERAGLVATAHGPLATARPGQVPVRWVKVEPPLPLAEYQDVTNGAPAPDRGKTLPWNENGR